MNAQPPQTSDAPSSTDPSRAIDPRQEWRTFALLAGCYGLWGLALFAPWWVAVPLVALCGALHSSLCHEALHGHPTRWPVVNAALVFPALTLNVPYLRFKDTHLAHHRDSRLTDPYDDPESNYLDPEVWHKLPHWQQAVLRAHNTLVGRMFLGPVVGQIRFMAADWSAMRAGTPRVLRAWLWHIPAMALVIWLVWLSPMSLWGYLVAVYLANALLRIRTFLEHRAHSQARARTVIIEDRGLLAFLFLNNNLHVVHHMHPKVPWYALPALYRAHKARYLARNEGYRYGSYGEIFRKYFARTKDPVPHPFYKP